MRIAINGIGIAGPTLAWWLREYGFEPVIFEKSPEFKSGGIWWIFGDMPVK